MNDDVPLTINYNKFLLEEKKQSILDFARIKLNDGDEFKVLKTMMTKCDINITHEFKNSVQISLKDIKHACEDLKLENIESLLDNLVQDSVKFLKKFADLYEINWSSIYKTV